MALAAALHTGGYIVCKFVFGHVQINSAEFATEYHGG